MIIDVFESGDMLQPLQSSESRYFICDFWRDATNCSYIASCDYFFEANRRISSVIRHTIISTNVYFISFPICVIYLGKLFNDIMNDWFYALLVENKLMLCDGDTLSTFETRQTMNSSLG